VGPCRRYRCYVEWLSRHTGKRYRLPTSHEWEIAARGGVSTRYPWGDSLGLNNAFAGSAFDLRRYPVKDFRGPRRPNDIRETGLLPANRFGLHDVVGNARELTSTFHTHPSGNCLPGEKPPCRRIIVRSGSGATDSGLSEIRFQGIDQANAGTGFRVVRE
jgi:formylglycine-generating enzyme required for sulfatase activity